MKEICYIRSGGDFVVGEDVLFGDVVAIEHIVPFEHECAIFCFVEIGGCY